ncbi:MAG: SUF system NifU family Fe-S cluster assembly protein [Deltaproteobacteria bacterium]|nr:MAG: SUF system NifU family Fe-S cluster assembly protein [Deltaproteobacteria bacterium]
MDELRELYQEVILDHSKHPRNVGLPEPSDRTGEGHNPLCGDQVKIGVRLAGDRIEEIGFEGSGCAISQAAASTLTEAVKGKRLDEVDALFERFHDVVTGKVPPDPEALGKLAVFAGVAEFPMRVKCATLPWHTLKNALHGEAQPASTE